MERRGLFVGIGIDAYESHEPLQHAVAEVNAVAGALGADFAGEPLLDPDLAHVHEHLKTVPGCLDTGSLVLLWCGHGVQSGTKLWLQTRDDRGKINAADVIARCAESGANQLLFIAWFTGREAEVTEVVSWVRARAPGVRMVTGSAGTGKSAIVGRVVSLSNPDERQRLGHGGARWVGTDPGVRSVDAHVHARGLTADRMAELLDGHLVRSSVLVPGQADRRNAAELVGALQRAAEGGARPPVLVVDGLDEARGEMFAIATDLLVRLAPYASIVVSTRPVTRAELPASLAEALQADAVLNLDDLVHRESGRVALRGYVVARLSGVAAEMDPTVVADRLVGESS